MPAFLTPESTKKAGQQIVHLISSAAEHATFPVNVFCRYDMMRRWHDLEHVSFDRIIDPTDGDRLHHSDWSARRMAEALADTIVTAAVSIA